MVYPHLYRTEHSETKTTNSVYGEYYAAKQLKKISIQPELLKIFQYIDLDRPDFLEDLKNLVKVPSIAGNIKYRDEIKSLSKMIEEWLQKLNMKYEFFNIGFYILNGQKVRIPSVILASYGNDPKKQSVCVYLHLDVPEPDLTKWDQSPFELTVKDNMYYGIGTSCGKGPLVMWFHVIQAFQGSGMELPVNIKFIIEFMHHQNSLGLADFLATRTQDFFANIKTIVVCEGEWIGQKHPCLIYGCVGTLHFEVAIEQIEGAKTDIKDDMNKIFDSLSDDDTEKITIRGFEEDVEQITPDEEKIYEKIADFDIDDIRPSLPDFKKSWDKVKLLMSFWRLPSLYKHDLLECLCENPNNSKIKRLFTIKIVPKQVVGKVENQIKSHIAKVVKENKIENSVNCNLISELRPWFENCRLPCYTAAKKACIQVFRKEPSMIREARSREVLTILDRVLEKNIIMLPLSSRSSNQGLANENISLRNYYEGTKLIAALMFQLANAK